MNATRYQIVDDAGRIVDASFSVEMGEVLFYARGGNKRSNSALNTEYGIGLRLVLERLAQAGVAIEEVLVDSRIARQLPISERRILGSEEAPLPSAEQYTLLTSRMKDVGRSPRARAGGGNSTKRILIRTADDESRSHLADVLGGVPLGGSSRLPASELRKVGAHHVWEAVQRLVGGEGDPAYGEPTRYELVTEEGYRLAPKEVFGLAASEALGFRVLPVHFTGGDDSVAVQVLRAAGFQVVPKGAPVPAEGPVGFPAPPEEMEVAEGSPRLVTHLRKERSRSLVRAKKESFLAQHGRLFCEACGLEPDAVYGLGLGDACIEVHHLKPVASMGRGNRTRLEDLQCLCANCHRVEHRRLRDG